MFTASTLVCAVFFLIEEQSESYKRYDECAPQIKKALSGKRTVGAASFAGRQDSSAEEL